jgi:hypothetical protein
VTSLKEPYGAYPRKCLVVLTFFYRNADMALQLERTEGPRVPSIEDLENTGRLKEVVDWLNAWWENERDRPDHRDLVRESGKH